MGVSNEAAGDAASESEDEEDGDYVPIDRGSTTPAGSDAGSDDENEAIPQAAPQAPQTEQQTILKGSKLALALLSLYCCMFLVALDQLILSGYRHLFRAKLLSDIYMLP